MKNAIGLCFLDEFDKVLFPSYSNSGADTHLEVQGNLLTIIEGGEFQEKGKNVTVDTSNIMFIGLGSFDQFRAKRENAHRAIGFGDCIEEEAKNDHFSPLDREAMLEAGGTNELLGRFNYVFNYGGFGREAVRIIIRNTVKKLEAEFECEIELSADAEDQLLKQANSKFGCRNLDFLIREKVLKAYTAAYRFNVKGRIKISLDAGHEAIFTITPIAEDVRDEEI